MYGSWSRARIINEGAWGVYTGGTHNYGYCSDSLGIRPALVLPSTALIDKNGMVVA